MDIHCVISPNFEKFYNEYFKASLPEYFDLKTHYNDKKFDSNLPNVRVTEGWFLNILFKVDCIIDILQKQDDSIFVFSDVDLVFNNRFRIDEEIREIFNTKPVSMIFQKDMGKAKCWKINTGFFAAKNNKDTLDFWLAVKKILVDEKPWGEQRAAWTLIERQNKWLLKLTRFPISYYCESQNFFSHCPRQVVPKHLRDVNSESRIYHANLADSFNSKYKMLDDALNLWKNAH